MAFTRFLVAALVLSVGVSLVDAKEKIGTRNTCHNYVCKTEYGYFNSRSQWDAKTESCECVPYYESGPCAAMKCEDGYITVENGSSCTCTWPCDNLHCTGPYVAMPDYDRTDKDNLCVCQLPPKSKCHDEL